jgi:hypothetical protein
MGLSKSMVKSPLPSPTPASSSLIPVAVKRPRPPRMRHELQGERAHLPDPFPLLLPLWYVPPTLTAINCYRSSTLAMLR